MVLFQGQQQRGAENDGIPKGFPQGLQMTRWKGTSGHIIKGTRHIMSEGGKKQRFATIRSLKVVKSGGEPEDISVAPPGQTRWIMEK